MNNIRGKRDLSDEYYNKYLKYKHKYQELKNKNLSGPNYRSDDTTELSEEKITDNVINFINNSSIYQIEKNLSQILYDNKTFCDKILGQGMMGEVAISKIGENMNVHVGNKIIHMPVVVKKALAEGIFDTATINKILYIYSFKNITVEAIILCYVNDIWRKKLSPHLPYMVGFGSCGTNSKILVDKIITERHGLDNEIEVKINEFNTAPLFQPQPDYESEKSIFSSNLATMEDLFKYINSSKEIDGYEVTLPNSEICNIVKLCDYLTISYLVTYDLLYENGIILTDMHSKNIFIHWLNKNSYMGDKYIGDIKNIIYQVGSEYIEIKTFGIVLKVGDIGSSFMHPRSDVFILGQAVDLERTHEIVEQLAKPNATCYEFLYNFSYLLPFYLYHQTVAYQILSGYPYANMLWPSIPYPIMDDMLTTSELLEKFSDYYIEIPNDSSNTLII